MADPQASLRALLGGGQNIANSRVAVRNKQLEDPRTSDPFRRMVMGENADEAAAQAQDPMAQKYRAISEGQGAAVVDNVPEIKAMREQELADKIALATAPARTAGEFNVKAAETAGNARADALQTMLGAGLQPGQRVSAGGVSMSQPNVSHAPSQSDIADRQYLTGLRSGKQHAQGYSFFSGPSQKDLDAAEIAKIEGRLGGGGPTSGMIRARDLATGIIHTAPAGTPLPDGFELIP